jgi:N-acetylglucosaminyldiphosphoundecaprenol N-acetyl-beta-D-mannosaminyltransferase
LFVGADSGVMHLAAAVSTPSIVLFGASNAQAWGAWSPQGTVRIVRSGVRCSPCAYVEHEIGAREGCPARTCMKLIQVTDVLAQARAILADTSLPPAEPVLDRSAPTSAQVKLLGVQHARLNYDDWIKHLLAIVGLGGFRQIVLSDYRLLLRARRDAVWRIVLKRADAVAPCGVALAWSANWLNKLLPEQIDRYGMVALLLETAEQNGWRVFLLADVPECAERAASAIHEFLPNLKIVGMMQGTDSPETEDALSAQVRITGADVLLVGFASPSADKWIARNSTRLGVALALGVGDVLRDLAGLQPQAPEWAHRWHIDGLYKLLRQPGRWRALWQVPHFVGRILGQRLRGER